MNQYAKFVVAALTAAAIAAQTALSDGLVSASEWVSIVIAALGALAVYITPNAPTVPPELPGKHELKED
jgi:hypothetical protein